MYCFIFFIIPFDNKSLSISRGIIVEKCFVRLIFMWYVFLSVSLQFPEAQSAASFVCFFILPVLLFNKMNF